mgnify:CR=1 FL=1
MTADVLFPHFSASCCQNLYDFIFRHQIRARQMGLRILSVRSPGFGHWSVSDLRCNPRIPTPPFSSPGKKEKKIQVTVITQSPSQIILSISYISFCEHIREWFVFPVTHFFTRGNVTSFSSPMLFCLSLWSCDWAQFSPFMSPRGVEPVMRCEDSLSSVSSELHKCCGSSSCLRTPLKVTTL